VEQRVRRFVNPFNSREGVEIPEEIYAELFYDLFFVAALTAFGLNHEIIHEQSVATYVAFFTVIW